MKLIEKDGAPRNKGGRPKGSTSNYCYSSAQKKKIAVRRALKQKMSTIDLLNNEKRRDKEKIYKS